MMKVVKAEALPEFRLRVRFEDGVEGTADLSRFAGKGVFRIWDEPGTYESVRVGTSGEVEWTDEVAICPDSLYLEITGKPIEEIFPNAKETSLGA